MNRFHDEVCTSGSEQLSLLTPPVIAQIDRALRRVGEYGEVRLVVAKGRLRFVETMQSEPAGEDDRQRERVA
jgi:hypothetical protein